MAKNIKKVLDIICKSLLLLFVSFLLVLLLRMCFIKIYVKMSVDSFSKNEMEVIQTSKMLLDEVKFSQGKTYELYMDEDDVKLNLYDNHELVEVKNLGTTYSECFMKKWMNDKVVIKVTHFYSKEDLKHYASVTYKKNFLFNKYTLWIYYGDHDVFPYCPDITAYRYPPFGEDNKKRLTENLYYAYARY